MPKLLFNIFATILFNIRINTSTASKMIGRFAETSETGKTGEAGSRGFYRCQLVPLLDRRTHNFPVSWKQDRIVPRLRIELRLKGRLSTNGGLDSW